MEVSFDGIMKRICDEALFKEGLLLVENEVKNKIVLYGFGRVGKRLFNDWKAGHLSNIAAICDNGNGAKEVDGVPILKHSDCVKQNPNSLFIISIQNGFVEIISQLIEDGIPCENIYFWDNARNKLSK